MPSVQTTQWQAMADQPKSLPADALQLLDFIRAVGDGIAAVAITLSAADAEVLVERELAKVAVEMRKTGEGASPSSSSVGRAIDACLRERIAARLAEWKA